MVDRVLERRRFAAPPGRHRRQGQPLAEQALANRRQKAEQPRRFENAGAQRIGDQHIARARCRDQAGDAEGRVGAQGGRIAVLVVETAQEPVDELQSLQCFQIDPVVAHRQIRSFDQREAQIARQKNMLKIGFVVRPRRQQGDQRLFPIGGRERSELLLQRAKKISQPLHAQGAKDIFVQGRYDEPVLHRITRPRGALGAIAHDPPTAIGRAREIASIKVQESSARRLDAAAGP